MPPFALFGHSVTDPESGTFFTLESGSEIYILDHIFESIETIFWVKTGTGGAVCKGATPSVEQ